MDWLTVAMLAAFAILVVGFGWRRQRLVRAAIAAVAVMAGVWALTAAAVFSGWKDSDGFIDCSRHCSPLQDASGVLFIFVPVTATLLTLLALIVWMRSGSEQR